MRLSSAINLMIARAARLVILALLLCSSGVAAAADGKETGPALWKIEGGAHPIWLFGSMHRLPAGLAWRNPTFNEAFKSARLIIFEANLFDYSPPQVVELVLARAKNASTESLFGELPADLFELCDAAASKFGLDPMKLDRLRPWAVALVFDTAALTRGGYRGETGVERALLQEAIATKKDLGYFETIDDQIELFAAMSDAAQMNFLRLTLNQLAEAPTKLAAMANAWVSGDVARLEALTATIKEDPEIYKILVGDTNARWLSAIKALTKEHNSIMIVVGALHLIGEDGVIARLRAEGYTVTGP